MMNLGENLFQARKKKGLSQEAVAGYEEQLEKLLANVEREYGYNSLDAFLVLKDILGQLWNKQANKWNIVFRFIFGMLDLEIVE